MLYILLPYKNKKRLKNQALLVFKLFSEKQPENRN
ncbi:hypothetical protein FHS90_002746 [Rufibacter quisquiliarum]|uniref:Uncharacterized protein n=1 Tax=Rufibacter quisquiliarum TaxID=1549639 RepID=A0A839GJV0_9BACT|nr:hypothetical protein [Rufibacter quisquiliarum]